MRTFQGERSRRVMLVAISAKPLLCCPVDELHLQLVHSAAKNGDPGHPRLDFLQVVSCQLDITGAEVLVKMSDIAGAWNRHNERLLSKEPGERDLRRRGAFLSGGASDQFHHRPSRRKVLGVKRSNVVRISVLGSSLVPPSILPVRQPMPTGPQGTRPMPSSSHAARTILGSTFRSIREYSVWTAVTGCTACARRIVPGPGSDKPKCKTLPA